MSSDLKARNTGRSSCAQSSTMFSGIQSRCCRHAVASGQQQNADQQHLERLQARHHRQLDVQALACKRIFIVECLGCILNMLAGVLNRGQHV
jgi:hypothetical protein